jgi:hypothetical protein
LSTKLSSNGCHNIITHKLSSTIENLAVVYLYIMLPILFYAYYCD